MRRSTWIVCVAGLVALGVSAVAVGGCASQGGPSGSIVSLTAADQGKTVTLEKGQKLEVTLDSNPTTGFSWQVKDDGGVLKVDGQPAYKAPDTKLVGAGGTETFTFTAVAAGRGSLLLEYRRPWETTATPESTFEVPIEVR